jgi:hypothetical protein
MYVAVYVDVDRSKKIIHTVVTTMPSGHHHHHHEHNLKTCSIKAQGVFHLSIFILVFPYPAVSHFF